MAKILDGVTANGTSDSVAVTGGSIAVCVSGTLDGATVTMEGSPDSGTTWVSLGSDAVITAPGWVTLHPLQPGIQVRANVTGVGTSSINCWVMLP